MELTLNLVWVCVAIAGILAQVVVLSRVDKSPKRFASALQKIIAMGCALVILFFVISMTDDLHNQQVMIEERKASRIAASAESAPNTDPARATPIGFFMCSRPPAFSLGTFAARRGIELSEFRLPAAIDRETLRGRAPPAVHA